MPKTKSVISENGDSLRSFAEWLEEHADMRKNNIKRTREKRAIFGTENNTETLKYYAKQLGNSGLLTIDKTLQYLTNLVNYGLIDNAILRKFEQKAKEFKNDESKFVQWMQKHPAFSSYIKYYTAIALISLMSWGGIKIYTKSKDKFEAKTEVVSDDPDKSDDQENNVEKNYDLSDANFVNNFIEENWDEIVIGLSEFETFRQKPVLQPGESRYTYGPGLTWIYEKNAKGQLKQKPCTGKYVEIAKGFSTEDMWQQAKYHLTYRSGGTLKIIKNQGIKNGFASMTKNQIMGLIFSAYQTPTNAKHIIANLAKAGEDKQQQADAFQYYKGQSSFKNGSLKRRWWCAAYYLGLININDLLPLEVDIFAKANINTLLKNKHFQLDENTIEYALSLKLSEYDRAVRKKSNRSVATVQDFVNSQKVLNTGTKATPQEHKVDFIINPTMAEMDSAIDAFNAKKFDLAINFYKKAIGLDINNIEAYSSIAISYKKLGDSCYEKQDFVGALANYAKCCDYVKAGNTQMNKNKKLLLDREVKAHLYYNAGQAHDKMAQIYKNQNNLTEAIKQYDLAIANYKTAKTNADNVENNVLVDIYEKAYKQSEQYKKNLSELTKSRKTAKTAAFQKATNNLKNKTSKILTHIKSREA